MAAVIDKLARLQEEVATLRSEVDDHQYRVRQLETVVSGLITPPFVRRSSSSSSSSSEHWWRLKTWSEYGSKSSPEDPYIDYITELKEYEVSSSTTIRAIRRVEMIKALPDFEAVPYYTYDVTPEELREALGWIDRESFRNLLAYGIIYKDDVWRIKKRLTLPEFRVFEDIATRRGITVEIIEVPPPIPVKVKRR